MLYDTRADTGNLNARIMLHKESCFEHKVHSHHTWTPAQHIVERIANQLQER